MWDSAHACTGTACDNLFIYLFIYLFMHSLMAFLYKIKCITDIKPGITL